MAKGRLFGWVQSIHTSPLKAVFSGWWQKNQRDYKCEEDSTLIAGEKKRGHERKNVGNLKELEGAPEEEMGYFPDIPDKCPT